MNRKTFLTIIKLIPVVSAILAYILIFSSAHAGTLTTAATLLAFFGFVFFFIGRKQAKEDKALKILGWLDILSTAAVIVLYALAMFAFAGGFSPAEDAEEDGSQYEVEEESDQNEAEDQAIGYKLETFESVDMDGNKVSDAIFADKDVTIVNVWATFCGPCYEEMPDLAKLAEGLPDNAQVIGVVIDALTADADAGSDTAVNWGGAVGNLDLAKQICDETGVKYTNILASDSVMETFGIVAAVPTTFIVDKSGKLVCSPIVGADVKAYKKVAEDYLAGL